MSAGLLSRNGKRWGAGDPDAARHRGISLNPSSCRDSKTLEMIKFILKLTLKLADISSVTKRISQNKND